MLQNILFASDIFSLLQRYILIASAIYPLRLKHLSTFHLNFRISLCHSAEIRLHPRKSDLATFLRTYKSLLSANAINENFCLSQFLQFAHDTKNGNNILALFTRTYLYLWEGKTSILNAYICITLVLGQKLKVCAFQIEDMNCWSKLLLNTRLNTFARKA